MSRLKTKINALLTMFLYIKHKTLHNSHIYKNVLKFLILIVK
jgi:hypothetical protein